jgi:hypothetical protein
MLLIYSQKITPRISYAFKHICTRILEIEISFTSVIEEFIAHSGPKLSYGKKPMGNELFIKSHGLLTQQGFEDIDILVKNWEDTKCFFSMTTISVLPFDIFAASFYLMSRYEEYLPHVKDGLGRYPASESLAFKEGFLQQPVIDIWAYKFRKVLSESFPEFVFPERKMIVHTVIEASQPYAYKQRTYISIIVGFIRDLYQLKIRNFIDRGQVILGLRNDPFNTFKWIINTAKRSRSKLSVFFLLGNALVFEENLNTQRKKFNLLVKYVADYKEVGLIFSHDSLRDYETLKKEKKRMEEMTNRSLSSSMNAQFLVSLPDIYGNLIELEVQKDFTMVYDDTVGFRAGTCTPFLFYDLDTEIKTPLMIHPIAMTTYAFEGKFESEIKKTVDTVFNSVENVNGTFSMLFSNKDFSASERNKIWRSLFSEKLQKYES